MKLATIALLGILLLASLPSMMADEKAAGPAGAGQVALAFTGGSAYTTATGGVCIWYPVLLGDLNLGSLFESLSGAPKVDKEHAYLIWVSDFSGVQLQPFTLPPSSPGTSFFLQLVSTGTATIYFSNRPDTRQWGNLTDRSSWGAPVATFVRKAGMFQSADGGWSGTMTNSAELVSSKPFKLNGKTFNFRDLIPNGMTCFETGSGIGNNFGDDEAGTCIAIGGGQ
ncbi:MAG: hypothetical protein ABSH05_11355 [Bryobacteraceae bacterium]|jgi:hypothetical protein